MSHAIQGGATPLTGPSARTEPQPSSGASVTHSLLGTICAGSASLFPKIRFAKMRGAGT